MVEYKGNPNDVAIFPKEENPKYKILKKVGKPRITSKKNTLPPAECRKWKLLRLFVLLEDRSLRFPSAGDPRIYNLHLERQKQQSTIATVIFGEKINTPS